MRSEALSRRSNSRGDNRRQERKKKSEITRRIYAKSHMIADVRVRICMPYRSVGVRPWRVHGVTAMKSSRTGWGKVTRRRSEDREGAGGSTQRARRCGDERSASRCRQPVTMLLPARRRCDLIEYLSIRRGVRSPESPTLALPPPPPPPSNTPTPCGVAAVLQYSSVCLCLRACARACALHNFTQIHGCIQILKGKPEVNCFKVMLPEEAALV